MQRHCNSAALQFSVIVIRHRNSELPASSKLCHLGFLREQPRRGAKCARRIAPVETARNRLCRLNKAHVDDDDAKAITTMG